MQNISIKLRPEDLNHADAAATLFKFQKVGRGSVVYPTIELCDDDGPWGAVYAVPDMRILLQGHPSRENMESRASRAPNTVWLTTALPTINPQNLVGFTSSPTLFHATPSKRSTHCSERFFWEAYRRAILEQTKEKYQAENRKYKTRPLKAWSLVAARRSTNFILKNIYARGDQRAMKAMHRFPFESRRGIYDAVCRHGLYAMQLVETFPLLASRLWSAPLCPENLQEVEDMVLKGAKLKEVAKAAGIPWALRNLPPQLTLRCLREHYGYAAAVWSRTNPKKLDVARAITGSIPHLERMNFERDQPIPIPANETGEIDWECDFLAQESDSLPNLLTDPESKHQHCLQFMIWAAKNIEECMKWKSSRSYRVVVDLMSILANWSCDRDWRHKWHPKLSFEKAVKYSELWHREQVEHAREDRARRDAELCAQREVDGENRRITLARQRRDEDKNLIFPDPWTKKWKCSHKKIKYEVVPLDRAYKVTEEGDRMSNCIATYKKDVKNGRCYIYSVRTGTNMSKSVATIELRKADGEHKEYDFFIQQAHGPCNEKIVPVIEEVIKKWCKKHRIARKHSNMSPPIDQYNNLYPTQTVTAAGIAWETDTSTTATTFITTNTGDVRTWANTTSTINIICP